MAEIENQGLKPGRPFLKWAGGKRQLLPELLARLSQPFNAYHEPFVGSGALFFELAAQGRITTAYLSDANASLIDVYLALRDYMDEAHRTYNSGPLSSRIIHQSSRLSN